MPVHPTTDPSRPSRPPTRRRRRAVVVLLLLLLLALTFASLGSGPWEPAAPQRSTAGSAEGPRPGTAAAAEAAREQAEEPVEFDIDLVDGDADPGDPGAADFDETGAGADPCAEHDPADGSLLVAPDPLVLPSGEMDGELQVRNCGPDEVAWSAASKPSVTLATEGGTLAPGEVFPVELTIDGSQWEPGAIELKVRVSEGELLHSTYVDVFAFRPLVGADAVATDQISAGEGAGGCSLQCITKAKLSTGYSSPDVGLDVATTVPAKVRVSVSKQAPVIDQDGDPSFPGTPAKATSPNGVQSWKTSLTGLQPTTKYFIIVQATDADGDIAYRHGTFRTVTPAQQDGGFTMGGEEPGCAFQCITRATVTPGDGSDPAEVVVRTHTPATFEVMLSTEPPTIQDGRPAFDAKDVWNTSGLDLGEAWDHEVTGLQPATTYYGIITARDANGKRSYATGRFTTDGVDVVITLHHVQVVGDGDDGKLNRGELSFAWGVGEDTTGLRGERKMHSGERTSFADHERTYTVHDAAGELPDVRAVAFERDADGLAEGCYGGFGAMQEPGSNGGCDWKWNVATSPAVRAGDLARLPDCEAMGLEDSGADGCLRIESEDLGGDFPSFWAIVSFTYVD